jgi:glycerophosphoryl diester phosphodiesterase
MTLTRILAMALIPFCLGRAEPASPGFLRNGVTAHRGNSGEFPENTLQAFESALALGADWIELDVYLTKDRQLAVTHDADTGRVGDKKLPVAASTYAELQTVDVAARFRTLKKLTPAECPPARIPLLADVLRLAVKQNRTRVSIQPKDECIQEAFRVIRELNAEAWVGFNDGSLNKMRQVKTQCKAVPVFWDRNADADLEKDIRIAREEGFECLVVHRNGITQEKVNMIHRARLAVGAWTVNDEAEMRSFLALGVDRLYTDHPALLLRLRKELK